MGDVGSAIATPIVAVGATVTGNATRRIYYDCPRCGKEVYVVGAAAAFAGRKCAECRSATKPLDLGVIGDAVDVAITPVTAVAATVTGNATKKIYYDCPRCGKEVYVSALTPHLKGKVCLNCKSVGAKIIGSVSQLNPAKNVITGTTHIKEAVKDVPPFTPGNTIIYIAHGVGDDEDNSDSKTVDWDDKISYYETKSCRILHGSMSWLANGIVQGATLGQADQIHHWWINIKTAKGDYYQLQFRGLLSNKDIVPGTNKNAQIELRRCQSAKECDSQGLAEANKDSSSSIDTKLHRGNVNYTIGDVINWLKKHEFSAQYNLYTHNCQDMCHAFAEKFN